MDLYGVKQVEGDQRDIELLFREIYLDYYSKALQPGNTKGKWIYITKSLNEESQEHQRLI